MQVCAANRQIPSLTEQWEFSVIMQERLLSGSTLTTACRSAYHGRLRIDKPHNWPTMHRKGSNCDRDRALL